MGQALTVTLPEFYSKLTLANIEGMKAELEIVDPPEYEHIINLSGNEITTEKDIKIHNIMLDDEKDVSYEDFKKVMDHVVVLLKQIAEKDEWVLVNCMAGSNRSVSAVICYALSKGWKLKDAIDYVEKRKSETGHRYWNTLGNLIFQEHLETFAS